MRATINFKPLAASMATARARKPNGQYAHDHDLIGIVSQAPE